MNRILSAAALWFFIFDSLVGAHPVAVTNPSFESPVLMPGSYTTYSKDPIQSIPGWTTDGGWQGAQNGIGSYDSATDKTNFAFNDGGAIRQTTGVVQAGTYKLTVAVGFRPGDGRAFSGGSLQLVAGNDVLKSFSLTTPKPGTFEDESLSYTVPAGDPHLGSPLTLKLVSDGTGLNSGKGSVDFDNVRLDFTPGSPEPVTTIHSIVVDEPNIVVSPEKPSSGDTWMPAWTKEGTVVSPANDTAGFNKVSDSNINFNRIDGDAPESLNGQTTNAMVAFGHATETGPDGCTWKSSGCLALNGTLYWLIARHKYGETSGDEFKRQPAHDGSIIKSTDGGIHWTRAAKENYDQPMFPGNRFAAAYFINYGQDGHTAIADKSDKYVYATSNNGFWDNGDDVVLGRVLRSAMPKLSASDWQYFTGGDGDSDSSWSSDMTKATPVISDKDHLGMTGAVYLPAQKSYLMICWYYPAGGGKLPDACTKTTWNFRVAPHPWGPWRSVGTHDFSPQGYYCPEVCPKFTSADGSKVWVFTAGNWNNGEVYRLTLVPISIQ